MSFVHFQFGSEATAFVPSTEGREATEDLFLLHCLHATDDFIDICDILP